MSLMPMAPEESELIAFLGDPASFGPTVTRVEHVQTHISHVFLTDHHAWKLKKRVTFDFADFATLDQRQAACEEELRVNRRLAPNVYLGLVPVVRTPSGTLALGPASGATIDYLVHMVRLPETASMRSLVECGQLQPEQIAALAERLATFYRSLPPLPLSPEEHVHSMIGRTLANRRALLSPELELDSVMVRRIHGQQLGTWQRKGSWFAERVRGGRVVDGHGDLRLDHIYFNPQPVVIDAIEFNSAFRRIDELDELCFLAMECDFRGAQAVACDLLQRYQAVAGDEAPAEFVAHYKTYRACVRAKVAGFRAMQSAGVERTAALREAERYVALADEYSRSFVQPRVFLVRGLSGTGKSVLARGLAEQWGCDLWQTDEIRRELFGHVTHEERYAPEARERVYETLLQRGAASLAQGIPVVLDGTFLEAARREVVQRWARELRVPLVVIRTECPLTLAEQRVTARLAAEQDASEIPVALLATQRSLDEPDPPGMSSLVIDTSDTANNVLRHTLTQLAALPDGITHAPTTPVDLP
jgi:aminoglycoside phosphotransferase family enzyme/predicted kinase